MGVPAAEVLAEEVRFYERERDRLVSQHTGKFALIRGSKLIGVFDTQAAAYQAGLDQLGDVDMLIIHLGPTQPIESQLLALHLGLINASPFV